MTIAPRQQTQIALIGFCLVLVLAWFCYRPALGGAFQLDDRANLGGLVHVEDVATATDFVLSGMSGPTGRPLALLTFALQADEWEQGARAFLRINILIHLLNAVVLGVALYWLAMSARITREKAVLVAAAASGAWVLLPLLATASLLVVQRMTTLSALFMLLGLAAYLRARVGLASRPGRALMGMSASLVVATSLAALCKESGLLLPVFVLVLEATVLERPAVPDAKHWRYWQAVFLWLPLAALLAYLASRLSYPDWITARRGFGLWERLFTEARILWLYLQKALLGFPGQLGIYQPSPAISRSLFELPALLACLSWLLVFAGAIVYRRRYPLFALGALWYLAGHMLESTVIPLEVYFEHRNYMALIGPLYAACGLLLLGTTRLQWIAAAVIPAFLLLSSYFLYSFASLWGEPSLASRYWALRYPDSVRAVTTMASYQLSEEGPLRTLQTLDNFVIGHPQHAYLRIQELNLLCQYAADQDHDQVLGELDRELPHVEFTYTAGAMLSELFSTSTRVDCNGVDAGTVAELANRLYGNSRYTADPLYSQFHHKLLAGIARHEGDADATFEHLHQAIAARPSSELNMMMVTALAGNGDFDAAEKFIDDALQRTPANPVRAVRWRRDLEGLRAYLRELEASRP